MVFLCLQQDQSTPAQPKWQFGPLVQTLAGTTGWHGGTIDKPLGCCYIAEPRSTLVAVYTGSGDLKFNNLAEDYACLALISFLTLYNFLKVLTK